MNYLMVFQEKNLKELNTNHLFDYAKPDKKAWYVVLADFVTMDDGTGIVHIAPAFGEDDYNVGKKYDLPVVQLVKLDGTFPDEVKTLERTICKRCRSKYYRISSEKRFT